MSSILQSSWKRVLVGLAFIIAGVLFGWLSENSKSIVGNVCGDRQNELWCFPLRLAFLDFGLMGISYTLISIGVILAVLYSYIAELLGSILSFALSHVVNSKNVVVDAMERGSVSREESDEIVQQIMSRYMGYYDRNASSFSQFLIKNFMQQIDKDGGFWRRDYYAIIRVDELSDQESERVGKEYLRWSEITSFSVENSKIRKTYPYKSQSTVEVFSEKNATDIIAELKYEVRAGGILIFNFDEHKENIKSHDFKNGPYLSDGLNVSVSHGDISIKVAKDVPVLAGSIDFVVDEESLISRDDTTFELCLVEPTKRLTFRFQLPEGFNIFHHGCSGRKFGSSISENVVNTQPGKNRVRLDVYDWCLPGIATVLAWKTKER